MKKHIISAFLIAFWFSTLAQQAAFKLIPLGVMGGSDESNLSSYMLAPIAADNFICIDAGTLTAGIKVAIQKKIFTPPAAKVLRNNIKGYLISHAHLDHVAGLILNSPDDTSKNIYALGSVINIFKEKYFTWQSWANFADAGDKPFLNKYHYISLDNATEIALQNTNMFVQAFPLSHVNPYESTAFLIRFHEEYILYLGDTGSDEIETSDNLQTLWQHISPLIKTKNLHAIFIECSFPNAQPAKQLFGHLTPALLMQEMEKLSAYAGIDAMKNLPVVITHIKPAGDHQKEIKKELKEANKLGLKILYAAQGEEILL